MIPEDYITEWRAHAPWVSAAQVEQDLVISRALVEIYQHPLIKEKLAFRGGTALHKIHLSKPYRYSEDLDFIQISQENIGETFDALREVLDPWLGTPRRELGKGLVKLQYKFESNDGKPLRLKVEINSREHFLSKGIIRIPYKIESRWYQGSADITTLNLSWLMGSKLRALYQRKKSRDLFDLVVVLNEGKTSATEIMESFLMHGAHDEISVSRAELEENLIMKMKSPVFCADLNPLLSNENAFDLKEGFEQIMTEIVSLFAGHPWKGAEKKDEKGRKC